MLRTIIEVIVIVAVIVFVIKRLKTHAQQKKKTAPSYPAKNRSYPDTITQDAEQYCVTNPHHQLELVNNSNFQAAKLMNEGEFYLFCLLDKHIKKNFPSCRVFTQVSMGEFLTNSDRKAFSCINSKRVDFLIINGRGQPCIVIEYQGSGHYQGNAIARDKVKKAACQKAHIEFVEVFPHQFEEKVNEVEALLRAYFERRRTVA